MLKGLISTIIAVGSMGAPIVASEQPYNNSIVERVVNEPISAVVYDDSNYTITLTADELNNYSGSNLISYIGTISSNIQIGLFSYDTVTDYPLKVINSTYLELIISQGPPKDIKYNYDSSGSWVYTSGGVVTEFVNNLTLTFSGSYQSYYEPIKTAIELDIQANQPSENNMPRVSDLFGYITQGVTAFIGSVGQAFNSVVTLFWDSTATTPGPTFLGLLMLVSIGAGLIFLAYNVIKKLVYRLRG